MNTEQIINELLSHNISKDEAIEKLNKNKLTFTGNDLHIFNVDSIGYTTFNEHVKMNITLPYGWDKIKNRIKIGHKIAVLIID